MDLRFGVMTFLIPLWIFFLFLFHPSEDQRVGSMCCDLQAGGKRGERGRGVVACPNSSVGPPYAVRTALMSLGIDSTREDHHSPKRCSLT